MTEPDGSLRPTWHRVVGSGLWIVAFVTVLFGIRLACIDAFGNATPYWDQWDAEADGLFKPGLEGRLDWRALVAPHVSHRILVPRALLLGVFSVNGIWNPLLEMVVNAAVWVGTIAVVVLLLDRATGGRHLPALLAFALVAFGLPLGTENMLWGFQNGFSLFVLWSTLALWAIAAARPFGPVWWAGVGSGMLGFLSLGSGSCTAAVAAAVAVAQYATGVRRRPLQLVSAGVLAALFVAGVMLTPSPECTASLRATSVGQALAAWTTTASWPLEMGPVGPFLVFLPAVALAVILVRRPPPAADARWFLLAAAAAAVAQSAALACARAAACLASRYEDLFAVGLLVNFACALAVCGECAPRHRGRMAAATVAWTVILLGGLAAHARTHARPELEFRRDSAAAQETHTRAYVRTGDIGHLSDKPWLHVPYPDARRLAQLLDDPVIRGILPACVAPPLAASEFASDPADGFVTGGADRGLPAHGGPTWGSHGTTGAGATGTATIAFPAAHRGYAVELPVAVGGDTAGITIEVEQEGRRWAVPLPSADATNGWRTARLRVRGRPFVVHLTDRTATGWVAVAAPVPQGRFDRAVSRLLDRWDRFLVVGIVLAVALVVHARLTTPDRAAGRPAAVAATRRQATDVIAA